MQRCGGGEKIMKLIQESDALTSQAEANANQYK